MSCGGEHGGRGLRQRARPLKRLADAAFEARLERVSSAARAPMAATRQQNA
jgi:hypothetical protein